MALKETPPKEMRKSPCPWGRDPQVRGETRFTVLNLANQRDYVGSGASFGAFDYGLELAPPGFQGLTFLSVVRVPVINAGYAPFNVVKDLADHQPGDAHAGHVAGRGAPQVMGDEGKPQGLQAWPSKGVVNGLRVMCLSLRGEGKTQEESPELALAAWRSSTARGERGTR